MTLETTRRRFLVGPDPCGPEGWATAMRRISVRPSFVSSPPGLLTDSTTAKAADRARRDHRAGAARRIEHRAAEVLFQPIGDLFTKLLDFFRRLAVIPEEHTP